jgi:predicted transcriptional regulator
VAVPERNERDDSLALIAAALAELQTTTPASGGDPGATTQELADKMGVTQEQARHRVQKAVRAGKMLVGWSRRISMIGLPHRVPVYRLAENRK